MTESREDKLRRRMADQLGYTPPDARAAEHTGDELRALLVAGARYRGELNIQAATHLLTFTGMPDWRGFPTLIEVIPGANDRVRDETYDVAIVPHWPALLDARPSRISGSGQRLLLLAVSMATGAPVDLRENLSGFGHAHARRVIEAVAIATGADEFYTLTPTPALDNLLAFHTGLTGEAGR